MVITKLNDIQEQLIAFGLNKVHQKSGNVMAQCPFHEDRNPSFGVHPSRGASCFSCRVSFHTVEDLFRVLSDKTGVEYDDEKIMLHMSDDYDRPSKIFHDAVIDQYVSDDDYFASNWGINTETVQRRNLLRDPFTGAECFPIRDLDSNFWGFVERFPPTKKRRSFYKYPSDFRKSDILLGEDIWSDEIFLTEGVRDLCAIESKIEGSTAVALGGCKASSKQIDSLRYYDKVILALDNDESGRRGIKHIVDELGLDAIEILKFEGKDPQESSTFTRLPPTKKELWHG